MRQFTEEQIDPEVILNAINDGVVTIGLDRRVHYINDAALKMLGYSHAEAMGAECADIIRCGACASKDCLMEQTLQGNGTIHSYDTYLINKAGTEIPISINATLLRDAEGQVIGEVEVIRDRSEQAKLSEALHGKFSFGQIIGKNHRMQEIYDILPSIAATKTTVLIEGETGTGKELIAHAIHEHSTRVGKPFVKFNCAALAEGVLESELFGHVKGAFTGASADKQGRFSQADGGTIFLDEIGDISPATQIRLLRVLQEESFEPVGSGKTKKVDVRVIAATHRDLKAMIRDGSFREDLYYRLRVMPVQVPPLRERHDDIPHLVKHFVHRFNQSMGKEVRELTPDALEHLMNYPYPGNVRELENILEHAMVLCRGDVITLHSLPKEVIHTNTGLVQISPTVPPLDNNLVQVDMASTDPLTDVERETIIRVLNQHQWHLGEAAKHLNISRTTLWRRMKRYDIEKRGRTR